MHIFKLAVIGSRTFNDYGKLKYFLDDCHKFCNITSIISGGASGADKFGAQWAKENNIELIEYLPDWEKYGKKAGFLRNSKIIDSADGVIAFWDMESKGTLDSINKAHEKGIDVFIYNFVEDKIMTLEAER